MSVRFCCWVGCGADAEFEIITARGTGGFGGPDPYGDFTDACEEHVGRLLGHQPDAVGCEDIYWQVIPLYAECCQSPDAR